MKNRTDAFNTGSYAQDQTAEPMDHISNRSKIKEANKKGVRRGSDGLYNALSAPAEMYRATKKANLPTDNHRWEHSKTVRPTGAHYNPMGQFGRTARTGAGSTMNIYGHNRMSARPSNAVGYAPNRRGSNAVPGRENTDRGRSGIPGNERNGVGENALASKFTPRGGFHGGARRS